MLAIVKSAQLVPLVSPTEAQPSPKLSDVTIRCNQDMARTNKTCAAAHLTCEQELGHVAQ